MAKMVWVIAIEKQIHHYSVLRVNFRVSVHWFLVFPDGRVQSSRHSPASAFNVIECFSPLWSITPLRHNKKVSLLPYKTGNQVFNSFTSSSANTIILLFCKSDSPYLFIFMMEKPIFFLRMLF